MNTPEYQKYIDTYVELNNEEEKLISSISGTTNSTDLSVLMAIAQRKLIQLNNAIQLVGTVTHQEEPLTVSQNPDSIVVVNTYLNPILLNISQEFMQTGKKYQVRVYLCLTPSNSVVVMTSDTSQPILQGRTVQADINGFVKFERIKIMEVSSNYQFQSFQLLFQLEDISGSSPLRVGNPVMSSPIQVITKEKRKLQEPEAPTSSKRCREDSQFVDITALLILPQKQAASKLGISESMLCKRFKEATRRKWPYRYLRKIEKMIHKMESSDLAPEEIKKLEFLREERSFCLKPLKIRVTGRTSMEEFPLDDIYSVSTSKNTFIKKVAQTDSSSESVEEDGDIENIALALHSLKNASN